MRDTKLKSLKRILMGFMVLVIVGVAGSTFWAQIPNSNNLKAKRVSQKVVSLPIGSNKSQVIALLKSEGLEYSYIGHKEGMDLTSAVIDNGSSSKNLSGYMVAIIRNTSGGFIVSGDVQYYFFFDKKGKLLKATTKEIFTGL